MKWEKKGMIFSTNGNFHWNKTHTHVVSALPIDDQVLRIYYSSRDMLSRCHPSFIDLNIHNLSEVLYIHDRPILNLGDEGTFDDCGIMPTWVVKNKNEILLYYIGWNVRNTVPYHNALGVAKSLEGQNFKKVFNGPIIHRNYLEPYFNGSACFIKEEVWKCWYLSCTGWEKHDNRMEPLYHIKYAESKDGFSFDQKGVIAIDYKNEQEGGISRPSVIHEAGKYKMWYSYRGKYNYRQKSKQAYKIGYAESIDGKNWNRKDDEVGIDTSLEGWDSEMIEYPFVIKINENLVMFYNGNGFGKTGFGYAILKV